MARAPESDNPLASRALIQATAAIHLAYTNPARARRMAESAVATNPDEPEVRAVAEHALGALELSRGDLTEATHHLRVAIALADDAEQPAAAAEARGLLGYVLTLTGDSAEALREVDCAQSALRGLPAVRLLMQRALILTELSRFDDALAGFEEALEALGAAGGDDLLEGDIHTNRSFLHTRRGDWRAAEDDLRLAEARYSAIHHTGRIASVHHNWGSVAAIKGDVPAALSHYDEAERRYRFAERDAGLLSINRAEALLSVRLVAEARAAADDGVAEFTRRRNAVDLVQARLVLADAALLDGDPNTAIAEAERARRAATRQERPGWAALASYVALRARREGGTATGATARTGLRTIAALDAAGWVVEALDARLIVARVELDRGRTAAARHVLANAGRARGFGPADVRARAWHAEALLRLADGDRRGARAAVRAGLAVLDRFRASLGATELRAHAAGHAGDLADLGVRLAMEAGRAEDVLIATERWRAGALMLPPARPSDDAALAIDLADLRQVVAELATTTAEGGDGTALRKRQAALEAVVQRRARHASGASTAGSTVLPKGAELRAALGPSALVEYLDINRQLHAVVVGDGHFRLVYLGPTDAAEGALSALRFGLRRLAYEIGSVSSQLAAAALVDRKALELDAILLGRVQTEVGDRPLVIVPTGALHALPWAALPSCVGRTVSVSPSAALWYRATTGPAGDRPDGPPVFASGPGLAHAVTEVTSLARRYRNARRFTGNRARVEAVTAALDGADLAHIAAHGHFRADNPLFSSIELADGPMTVYDLERLHRPPRCVVLSSCDSGLPTVRPGDELLGLAAALLGMSTTSLVASVIPVPDDASHRFMMRFHRHLRAGRPTATALARARQDVSGDPSPRARVAAMGFLCFGAG